MKFVLTLLILAKIGYSDPKIDEILEREVRFDTGKWPVFLGIPAKEFLKCFKSPTNVNWKILEVNQLLLTFQTHDEVMEKTNTFKVLFRELPVDGGCRYIALINRIIVNGIELSPHDRDTFGTLLREKNTGLESEYLEWFTQISETKKGNDQDPQSKSLDSMKNASSCDSVDSTFVEANYADQIKNSIAPIYPDQEFAKGHKAIVEASINLSKHGKVIDVTIIRSGGISFDNSVISAINASTFKPFLKSGCKVQCRLKKKFIFEL
ncbi:MAG: TonB family protein [Flavobacteriales bacterium]|nr:TonB family protein [Flavobacteriales bacterium]